MLRREGSHFSLPRSLQRRASMLSPGQATASRARSLPSGAGRASAQELQESVQGGIGKRHCCVRRTRRAADPNLLTNSPCRERASEIDATLQSEEENDTFRRVLPESSVEPVDVPDRIPLPPRLRHRRSRACGLGEEHPRADPPQPGGSMALAARAVVGGCPSARAASLVDYFKNPSDGSLRSGTGVSPVSAEHPGALPALCVRAPGSGLDPWG